jgi:ABC-type oligopeptide transport system substrate-binding subunit/DNA-binding SARP family transcriptional activator
VALLGYLAAERRSVARDSLAALLWPDEATSKGRSNLRRELHNLAQILPDCWELDRQAVAFVPSTDVTVDLYTLLHLETEERWYEAAELLGGEFLEGLYLDDNPEFERWLLGERERWQGRAEAVLTRVIEAHTRRGHYADALRHIRCLLQLAPWNEEAHRQAMRLLAWTGQRGAALRQFEACKRALWEELGVEPTGKTTALYRQIHAGKLDFPPQLPAFLTEEGARHEVKRPLFVARERELARLDAFLNEALVGQGRVVLITGGPGSGKTALIQAFARRAQTARADLVVAGGNCNAHTGIGDPYLPFREILGLLTGDVEARWAAGAIPREHARRLWSTLPLAAQAMVGAGPNLIDTFVLGRDLVERAMAYPCSGMEWMSRLDELVRGRAPGAGAHGLQQSDLFEQYARVLHTIARERPLVLVVDDLQWADAGSINLLFHLGRRLTGSRVLIVGAFRPEEVALGRGGERHPLEAVVNEFQLRSGDTTVNLGQAESRDFVEDFLDTEPNRLGVAFRDMLYRQTRGHPLFTVELLRGMQERGDLIQDREGRWVEGPALDWKTLPPRVEAVIAERIGRLDEPLQAVLRAASVEGETFTAEVVARVQRADEWELVARLSGELDRRHRLLRAQGILRLDDQRLSTYRFRHILYQKYLYNSLDPVERAHLHEAVGETLEALCEEQPEAMAAIAGQLAWHFQEAGMAAKAIAYLNEAGDRARGLYAHQEAIGAYERALALLKEQGDHGRAARTLMKLGLTYHTAFRFGEARQAYEEGFALWHQAWEVEPAIRPLTTPHALRVHGPVAGGLDPADSSWLKDWVIIRQIFSGLAELTPENEVVPDIARSWEVLDSGRRYVFHLRDDVEWSDGVPVTAGDFEYALKRRMDPFTAFLWYDIKGARALQQGEASTPDAVGVRALDDMTLAVELEGPTGYFVQLLPRFLPVPRHAVEAHGEAWTEAGNIVTNGPFRLEEWKRHESITLVRNPQYHGRFSGNLERVELVWLASETGSGRLEAYEGDNLDVLRLRDVPSLSERDRGRQRHAGEYVSSPELLTSYVGFNVNLAPFDDVRMRRAFILATDRETVANVVLGGYVFPATGGFIPPGMPGHSPGIALPYDPEEARQLLAEAGYPGGRGFPAVEMRSSGVGWQGEESGLQTQWRENLGVEISWQVVRTTDWAACWESDRPVFFRMGYLPDYRDPDSFLRGCPGLRFAGWQNDRYEALVEEARRTTGQEERMNLYRQADRILIEEAVLMPLYYSRMNLLVKPCVTRHPVSVTGEWFWKDVIMEPH